MSLAPLFELSTQFQAKNGRNNTAGFLRVFEAGTDDPAVTYSDYNGTLNERDIYLDDDGRAVVICDSSKAYRLEVYDANGMLMWTEEPVWCTGSGGGGSVSVTRVESTDGSISVVPTTVGSVTTYDLAIAPDTKGMLEWVTAERQANADGALVPFYVDGTMEIDNTSGLFLQANELYHVTNSFTVTPTGTGIAYDTLTVKLMLDSTELCSRSFDIDSSLTDPVECEFSYDVSTTADGYLYWIVSGTSAFTQTMAKMQVHRIYSGLAAVPSTYATKAYVDSGLSSKISYSALEYSTANQITAISGSAIGAAGVDPNEFVPWSASGVFQPSADMSSYVPVSAIEGNGGQVTGISGSAIRGHEYSGIWPVIVDNTADTISVEDKTLAVDETMTGYESAGSAIIGVNTATVLSGMSAYAYESSLSSKLDASASSDFYPFSGNPSGFLTAHQSLAGLATESYVDSSVSSKLDATASSLFITALPADLATTADVASAVSGKMDLSASSSFYPMTSNPSGYLTAHQSLAGLATEEYVDSAVSSKVDTSAYDSAWFYSTSNPSGFATTYYVDSAVSGVEITFDSSITTASSTAGITASVNTAIFSSKLDETAFSTVSGTFLTSVDLTPYQLTADMSGYLQTSESSNYYPASNPSGFITGIDLSDYATTAYVDSSVSGKLDASAEVVTSIGVAAGALSSINNYGLSAGTANSAGTALYDSAGRALTSMATKAEASGAAMAYAASAISSVSSNYYPTSNPSGFISGVDLTDYATTAYVDSAVSGVEISFDSSISTASSTAGVTASVNTAIFSGKLDASASSDFYLTSNPSGFITGVDLTPYQLTADMSGYLQTSESSNYYSTSNPSGFITGVDLSPYQTTADMSAYQPSGDYIYASALGTGVI